MNHVECRRLFPRDNDDTIAVVAGWNPDGTPILSFIKDPHCCTRTPPDLPDDGICHPRRFKYPCDAPVIPGPQCGDFDFVVVYNPDATPKFTVISILRDSDCDPILDDSGNQITTRIT